MPNQYAALDDNMLLQLYAYADQYRVRIAAFETLYHRYHKKIYSYLCKILGNKDLAEDLFQDLWRKIIENRIELAMKIVNEEFVDQVINNQLIKRSFQAYLYTMARNACLDYLNKIKNESLDVLRKDPSFQPPIHNYEQPEAQVEFEQLKQLLDAAITRLPREQKDAYLLQQAGISLACIADMQGVTYDGVRTRIRAALRSLRKELEQWKHGRIDIITKQPIPKQQQAII